jgi:hypothetical protein
MIHACCPRSLFGSTQRGILRSDRKPGTATRSFLLVFVIDFCCLPARQPPGYSRRHATGLRHLYAMTGVAHLRRA